MLSIDRVEISAVAEAIFNLINEWELDGNLLIGLVTDGLPEISGGSSRGALLALLRTHCPNVVHLQSTFPTVAMAFDAALRSRIPCEIEFLLRQSHNWFASCRKRQADYSDIVESVGFDLVQIESHDNDEIAYDDEETRIVPNRGLRLIPPELSQWEDIGRYAPFLVDNYDALMKHFETVQEECYEAKLLTEVYSSPTSAAYLRALSPFLTGLRKVLVMLRVSSDRASNVLTSERLGMHFRELADKLIKQDVLDESNCNDLCDMDIEDNCKSSEEIDFGSEFSKALDSLDDAEKTKIRINCVAFLKAYFKGLQSVLKDSLIVLSSSEQFFMPQFLENTMERSSLIGPFFGQTEEELAAAESKYRLLRMLDWKNRNTTLFWLDIHTYGDPTNRPLRALSNGVLNLFCVPLFDAEIDRMFEEIRKFRWELQGRMTPALIEAAVVCKTTLWKAKVTSADFEVPLKLLTKASNVEPMQMAVV